MVEKLIKIVKRDEVSKSIFFLTPILAIILTLIGGGLIFYFEKSVPEVGKLIKHANGLIFKIMESDMRRIKKIKVTGSPKV